MLVAMFVAHTDMFVTTAHVNFVTSTVSGISIWDFKRHSDNFPSWMNENVDSISDSHLQSLGEPAAYFSFGTYCSADHFYEHSIIFNIELCGGWAGGAWPNDCVSSTGFNDCESYVKNVDPHAFDDAYFDVNYLKVFHLNGAPPVSPPTPSPAAGSCGYIPNGCQKELEWAAYHGTNPAAGTDYHPEWYPDFETITGVSFGNVKPEDVELYWVCNQNPNPPCVGLTAPCGGRSCGVVSDGGSSAINDVSGLQLEPRYDGPVFVLNTAQLMMVGGVLVFMLLMGFGSVWCCYDYARPKVDGIAMMKLENITSGEDSDDYDIRDNEMAEQEPLAAMNYNL